MKEYDCIAGDRKFVVIEMFCRMTLLFAASS